MLSEGGKDRPSYDYIVDIDNIETVLFLLWYLCQVLQVLVYLHSRHVEWRRSAGSEAGVDWGGGDVGTSLCLQGIVAGMEVPDPVLRWREGGGRGGGGRAVGWWWGQWRNCLLFPPKPGSSQFDVRKPDCQGDPVNSKAQLCVVLVLHAVSTVPWSDRHWADHQLPASCSPARQLAVRSGPSCVGQLSGPQTDRLVDLSSAVILVLKHH